MNEEPTNREFIAHYREIDKQPQGLWEHLEETALLSANNADKIGLAKQGELIGLVHDLGKATAQFDQYIRSATGLIDPDEEDYLSAEDLKGKIDHSSAGAQLIFNYLNQQGPQSILASQFLTLVITSHHSGLIDCITPDGIDKYSARMAKAQELTRIVEAEANLPPRIRKRLYSLLDDAQLVPGLIATIKNLRDDNDSQETLFFKMGLLVRFLFSCLIDADRTNTAEFENPYEKELKNDGQSPPWKILAERLEQYLGSLKNTNEIDEIRRDIADYCLESAGKGTGIYQLTVPTGGGKTLSSLRFALHHAHKHGLDRIIYVIPYTSIIDQNADVVRNILETPADHNRIVLEHHSNLTPEKENTLQKILSRNWDAPVVFTTMVQFLETLFGGGTRSARRMHQLANAVLIFDEVQTLPVKCVHMFNIALRFLVTSCRSSVVLCTATQPLLDEIDLPALALSLVDDKKIIKDVSGLFNNLKRVEVSNQIRPGGWPENDIVELAAGELQLTGSVLIVVNTKNSARRLFKQLYAKYQDSPAEIFHLSTSMCPVHRMEVLRRIKEKLDPAINQPVICVSTQLIEAGVDIDFGSVIRYLAGLDSIAQAAGRCNRNGRRKITGRVIIVNPADENLERLLDIKAGVGPTLRVLEEYKNQAAGFDFNLIGDKAIKRYYEYYFHERRHIMSYPVSKKSALGREDNLFRLLAKNELSVQAYERETQMPCRINLRQSFASAAQQFQVIDAITRGVIVPYRDGAAIIGQLCSNLVLSEYYRQLKQAQRYSVNLWDHEFQNLAGQEAIFETKKGSGIYCLDQRYYSEYFGFTQSEEADMDFLCV